MEWSATGASLYYSRIYNGTDTFEVSQADIAGLPAASVFAPNDPDGVSYNARIMIGDVVNNQCLPAGEYTVQVWSVRDADGDRQPDRDGSGAIIGCFVECDYFFQPSCPQDFLPYFTVDSRDVGCNQVGGFIRLANFNPERLYCIEPDGTGVTVRWTGPNGFTANTPVITGLEPGIYSAEVTGFYGCTAYWDQDVRELDKLAFSCAVREEVSTVGGNDGVVELDIVAGGGSYDISWTGPVAGELFDVSGGDFVIDELPPGTYEFTIVDLESTCVETCSVVIEDVDCSELDLTVVEQRNSDCDGNPTGGITVTFGGGDEPRLTWAGPGVDGSDATTLDSLGPGLYRYEVRDLRGCVLTGAVTIAAEPAFTFACGSTDETLPFLDDGTIGIGLSGGTPPFTLSYTAVAQAGGALPERIDQPVTDGDTLRDLMAGTYFILITDATGCARECVATVTEADCDIFPNCTARDPVSIFGEGSVTLEFDGGPDWFVTLTGPRDTTLVTGVPSIDVLDLPQGDYTVDVYNTEGCIGGCTFAIVPPPCTLAAVATARNPRCNGDSNGQIVIDVTGASEGLVIDWNVDAYDGLRVASGLAAGEYVIWVSDRTECPLDPITVTLTEPVPLELELVQTDSVACYGEATAALRAAISGGVPPLTLTWSDDAFGEATEVTGLPAGSYALNVTDATGCAVSATITVGQPRLLEMTCSATAETVASLSDGTVSVAHAGAGDSLFVSGALGDFTLPAVGDTTFTGLPPGNYDLTLTDRNGCTTSCTAIVNPGPCLIALTTAARQPECDSARGRGIVTVVDNFGPVTYRWSSGDTTAVTGLLDPGAYTVTLTDATGCEAIGTVSLQPFTDVPTLNVGAVSPVCEDDCAELQLTLGGTPPFTIDYEFQQAGGPVQTATLNRTGSGTEPLCPGTLGLAGLAGVTVRLVRITDGNGCARALDRTLNLDVYPPARGELRRTLCPGERLDIYGERFDADRPTAEITLPIPSANGCDSTLLVVVDFFAPAFSVLDVTRCRGAVFELHGQTFSNNRLSGEVVVPEPSANGCDSTVLVSLDFYPPATGVFDTLLCPGETLDFFGEVFHANRRAGEVVVPTPSVNGCDSTVSVTVNFRAPAAGVLDTMICADTRLAFGGQFFDVNRPTGEVRLPGAAAAGCDSLVTVNLGFHPRVIGELDTTVCAGDTVRYGDVVFDRPARDVIVNLGRPDRFGCDSLVNVRVRNFADLPVQLGGDGVICPGGEVALGLTYAGGGTAFVTLSTDPLDTLTVPPGGLTVTRLLPVGTTVTIASARGTDGCPPVGRGSVTVRDSDLGVSVDVLSGDDVFAIPCADEAGGEVVAVPAGGSAPYEFVWNTGATGVRLTDLPPGQYAVTVTSGRGCTAAARVDLAAPPPLVVSLTDRPPGCADSTALVVVRAISGGVGPYLLRTSQTNGFQLPPALPDSLRLPPGAALVEVEDANGCRLRRDYDFRVPPPGEIVVSPRTAIIAEGDSVRIQVATTVDVPSYVLTPGPAAGLTGTSFFVGPPDDTRYELTATDTLGCTVRTFFDVLVDDFVPIYAPNVFSPGGDGVNDLFRIFARNTVVEFSDFAVYGRWGEKLYELPEPVRLEDANWGWDGRDAAGRPYEQGVYVYKVTVRLSNGRVAQVAGDVLLLR